MAFRPSVKLDKGNLPCGENADWVLRKESCNKVYKGKWQVPGFCPLNKRNIIGEKKDSKSGWKSKRTKYHVKKKKLILGWILAH